MSNPRLIAFYLPQFYPTPENDAWWEPGFTEWTNVACAKPLFRGHYQPRIPRDLSFYDLRVPQTREKQAELAREAGIEGFCYWHYWFGNGKRLLSEVFTEVVESGKPDFPFCLCWANHSWYQKTWDATKPDTLLVEQTYPGREDIIAHFNAMLPAFKDKRYMKTSDGRLIFGIYSPMEVPDFMEMKNIWNSLAKENGIPEFYFFAFTFEDSYIDTLLERGYDATVLDQIKFVYKDNSKAGKIVRHLGRTFFGLPNHAASYDRYARYALKHTRITENRHAAIDPNFDHSPRSGKLGIILTRNAPEKWGKLLRKMLEKGRGRKENLLFIKAWNEWGEGNYLEPDRKFGKQYIEATAKAR
ncbi:MAG: glycoside hydrolase family 99-like domain-containing protein [Bacteroidales bacterium]|nr:glycoside hydrolase family 99-like domain-containing protein [Bacteroidales bacterium]